MNIQVTRFMNMPRQQEAVQNARFSRAVCAVNQGQRPDRYPLRFGKRLEIANFYGRQHMHCLSLPFVFTGYKIIA